MKGLSKRAVALLAFGLLLCIANLGARALWQDEAACALLGQRWFEYGQPLGYSDGNLITMDTATPDELASLNTRTGPPAAAVEYFVERGDFRADTGWIGQPWGSIAIAGAALQFLGEGSLQARLPFAIAGFLTLVLLYFTARRIFESENAALVALALCTTNVWWLTHVRQCRYYATATLFALATFALYLRWRSKPTEPQGRGAFAFIAAAWLWFQQDFGSFWPVIGVLAFDTLLDAKARRRGWLAFVALGVSVAPFVFFYGLHDRLKPTQMPFDERLGGLAWMLDRYQLPLVLLLAAALLLLRRSSSARRPMALAVACIAAQLLWLAAVSPAPFYRYIVDLTPFTALVLAWLIHEIARRLPAARQGANYAAAALVCALTPWLTLPTASLFRASDRLFDSGSPWVRSEWAALAADLRGALPDPNRAVVDFLEPRLQPGDEILVTYEDLPLAFHLDAPIRGGIPCFRVNDAPPPRWFVLRKSAGFVPPGPYGAVLAQHQWIEHVIEAPDIPFGNNPDPRFHRTRWKDAEPITILERR